MCLALLALDAHPSFRFIFCGNRDEFYTRQSHPAVFRGPANRLLGGRDLQAGGTWLGITRDGKFATVTNYRELNSPPRGRSRGLLPESFLLNHQKPRDYLDQLQTDNDGQDAWPGFNLLVGLLGNGPPDIWYSSNRGPAPEKLETGVHGLSNHLLNTDWPKVTNGKQELEDAIHEFQDGQSVMEVHSRLRAILRDSTLAGDDQLPDTGIGIARERQLSPRFVASDGYGTRASTVITVDCSGQVVFSEQNFLPPSMRAAGVDWPPNLFSFRLPS